VNTDELGRAFARAREGDQHAFATLWRTLQPSLLRYLRVVVGDAAPDVASETWLQAARDVHGFRGDGTAFRVWLFRVARHRAIDELRRAGRRPEEPRDLDGFDGPTVRFTAPDAALEALDRLDTDWALAVIGTLPRDQAEAVMLRVVAGLDVAQTANVLGKRAGAVRIAAMRGLRRLATHVEVQARRPDATGGRLAVGREAPRPEGV